ncbi:MAG TPA: hypothetical protein VFG79_05540, partial [Solirubrobacter sp.]|nr:hypothetical protein [Solirubrobacter sp.]
MLGVDRPRADPRAVGLLERARAAAPGRSDPPGGGRLDRDELGAVDQADEQVAARGLGHQLAAGGEHVRGEARMGDAGVVVLADHHLAGVGRELVPGLLQRGEKQALDRQRRLTAGVFGLRRSGSPRKTNKEANEVNPVGEELERVSMDEI